MSKVITPQFEFPFVAQAISSARRTAVSVLAQINPPKALKNGVELPEEWACPDEYVVLIFRDGVEHRVVYDQEYTEEGAGDITTTKDGEYFVTTPAEDVKAIELIRERNRQ